ncbi:TadE/TadG family type IV pilus assembly protein [Planctomicrobium sp. SH661]|uniref:TadE/TadG family type IV pilus assembly protein n=1 Tax=Planctomicrobium sp. SH661 TaxID=3448124 RepID=UPI003F5C82D2
MLHRLRHRPIRTAESRSGAVLVENAIVCAVFGLFLAGIMELGHAYMVMNTMNAAVKRAARYGTTDGVTTAQVKTMANNLINKAFKSSKATIIVKDGSAFDTSTMNPKTINYDSLANLELSSAKKQQMFIVRVTVPYNSVALLPPFWVKNATLKAQAVMRHE